MAAKKSDVVTVTIKNQAGAFAIFRFWGSFPWTSE